MTTRNQYTVAALYEAANLLEDIISDDSNLPADEATLLSDLAAAEVAAGLDEARARQVIEFVLNTKGDAGPNGVALLNSTIAAIDAP